MYNIIWYNGKNFCTKITKNMLITKGNKKFDDVEYITGYIVIKPNQTNIGNNFQEMIS